MLAHDHCSLLLKTSSLTNRLGTMANTVDSWMGVRGFRPYQRQYVCGNFWAPAGSNPELSVLLARWKGWSQTVDYRPLSYIHTQFWECWSNYLTNTTRVYFWHLVDTGIKYRRQQWNITLSCDLKPSWTTISSLSHSSSLIIIQFFKSHWFNSLSHPSLMRTSVSISPPLLCQWRVCMEVFRVLQTLEGLSLKGRDDGSSV